jgi:hypothetical protein
MAVTEYYDFTCLLTLDDPTAPLKFHHEFRSADGYDASPSEIWTTLTFNWATGAFEQTQDFAALFEDPAEAAPTQSNQAVTGSSGTTNRPTTVTSQAAAPAATGPAGAAAPSQGMSVPGPTAADFDDDGFDPWGFDRSGYDMPKGMTAQATIGMDTIAKGTTTTGVTGRGMTMVALMRRATAVMADTSTATISLMRYPIPTEFSPSTSAASIPLGITAMGRSTMTPVTT